MEKHTKMNFISKALTALALSATVSTSAFAADSVNTTGLAVTDTTVSRYSAFHYRYYGFIRGRFCSGRETSNRSDQQTGRCARSKN